MGYVLLHRHEMALELLISCPEHLVNWSLGLTELTIRVFTSLQNDPTYLWQLRTWIHDNLCYLTSNCDTGQHSRFLRCFSNCMFIVQAKHGCPEIYIQHCWKAPVSLSLHVLPPSMLSIKRRRRTWIILLKNVAVIGVFCWSFQSFIAILWNHKLDKAE